MPDLEILRKFLITVMPDASHEMLNETFQQILLSPAFALSVCFDRTRTVFDSKEPQHHKFYLAQGIITGILLAYFTVRPEDKQMFEDYFKLRGRETGENVINFQMKKGDLNGRRGQQETE